MDYFFAPFVGNNYSDLGFNGKKILILGESHHCGEACDNCGKKDSDTIDCNNFTKNTIKVYLDYKKGNGSFAKWMNTFSRFANIVNGKPLSDIESFNFWNSVIFYNYVQKAMDGARISPSIDDFQNSQDSFFTLLSTYLPDLIIVWGDRLWNKLPNNGKWGDDILDGGYGKLYYYEVSGKRISAMRVYHPASSALTYEHSKYIEGAILIV